MMSHMIPPPPGQTVNTFHGLFSSNNDVFQTFFAHEKNLNSDDLGQVVKSLSELKRIIKNTENKLLLNSVTSKIANYFENAKNLYKYQYLKFFQDIKPFFQGIQNKKEILDITSKLLTSNDYISRIVSTQFIALMKDYIEDRVDVLHNLMSVAISTQSQLEIRFLFKAFAEICEGSEAFSFTFLQQYRQIFERFKTVVPMKKLVVLIQKSARNISDQESLVVLIGNIKSDLEFDFQNLQKGNNTLDLIYANIILMGNLLLYTFSHTSELIHLVMGVFFFFTDNQIPNNVGIVETPYIMCKQIVNLFKRLFQLIPSLKFLLDNERNQIVNKVVNSRQLSPSISNKIFLEVITMLGNEAPLDSITDFFLKLSDDLKLNYFLQNGNNLKFPANDIRNLCQRRIQNQSNSSLSVFIKNQPATVLLLQGLPNEILLGLLEVCRKTILDKLKNKQEAETSYLGDLFEVMLLVVVSLNLNTQALGEYFVNVYSILQNEIWVLLDALKGLDKVEFDLLLKKVFLMIMELGKMSVSMQANPQRFENTILKFLEKIQNSLSKQLLYWILKKTFINNYFLLCKWSIQELMNTTKAEKVQVWFGIVDNLCNICSDDKEQSKNLQLLKIMNSMKYIKSEESFSYQYLRCFFLLHSNFQEMRASLQQKGSANFSLTNVYNSIAQLKLLKDKYFLDRFSKISLKIFAYLLELVAVWNTNSLEEQLKHINSKLQKWLLRVPFHDGETDVIKYYKSIYQKTLQTKNWDRMRLTILDDFLNFKLVNFPRTFLDFKHPLDLSIRLVNQDEYINKKTHEINTNSSFSYVMDIRVHIHHLSNDMKEILTLQAETVTTFHHNYGSKDDATFQISKIQKSGAVNEHSNKHMEFSFLYYFPSIGKFTNKITLNLLNKKSKVIYTKSETWLINVT